MIRGSALSSSGIGSGSSRCQPLPGGPGSSFITQCLRGECHGVAQMLVISLMLDWRTDGAKSVRLTFL